MNDAGSMSDDPSLGGDADGGEGEGSKEEEEEGALSPRPTATMEDFLFDPKGGWLLWGMMT